MTRMTYKTYKVCSFDVVGGKPFFNCMKYSGINCGFIVNMRVVWKVVSTVALFTWPECGNILDIHQQMHGQGQGNAVFKFCLDRKMNEVIFLSEKWVKL